MQDYKEFLTLLHGEENSLIKADARSKDFIKVADIDTENKKGKDIFFYVNCGGTKADQITRFNACFIDCDAGKTEDGNYKDTEDVNAYKASVIDSLKGFIEPSIIIETRNGYHIYWLLKGKRDAEIRINWESTEKKLITRFNSDPKVKDASRMLRVPYTYWMKDRNHPYYVTPVKMTAVAYTIGELQAALENVAEYGSKTSKIKGSKAQGFSCSHNKDINNILICGNENLTAIKANDINGLKALIDAKPIQFDSYNACMDYIKTEIDMADFLGIENPRSFKCIMHNDKMPSASIFESKNGEQIYVCNSNSCGFKGNIIRVVEAIVGCSRDKAIQFIMAVYNITVEESETVKLMYRTAIQNIKLLLSSELEDTEPEIHGIIWRYYNHIIMVNNIALDNIHGDSYSNEDGNLIFFFSQKYFAKKMDKSYNSKILPFLSLLGFVNRLNDEDVPVTLRDRARAEANNNEVQDSVQFYTLPSYGYNTLKGIKQKAVEWKNNSCSMRGMSREMIFRTFGEEEADRVYPKREGKVPTQASDEFQEKFEALLLKAVNKKGYAKEADVVAKMAGWKNMNETRAKRILAESLKNLGMERERANKKLKEKYSIKGEGYPFIIHR